jgi:hypothetical protein
MIGCLALEVCMTPAAQVPPIREEFIGAELGDARRSRRLVQIAEALAADPARSLPEAMGSEAGLEGAYRFFGNPRVRWFSVLNPHIDKTWDRARRARRVLCVSDTTEFGFRGEAPKEGLSQLGKDKQGFLGHVALAVSADGHRQPLGVLGVLPVVRAGTIVAPDRRADDYTYEVESERWATLVELVEDERPADLQVVHVMDREGDQYPLLAQLLEFGTHFVIRLCHDRRLADEGVVSEVAARAPLMFTRSVKLSRRRGRRPPKSERTHPTRDERMASLEVRATRVVLRRPRGTSPELPAELSVNIVHVTEPEPPPDVEPMEWTLLTTLPIESPDEVAEVVDAYRARWLIEEYFKAVKTGCAYTTRQLESLEALLVALAVTLPIAWRLLALRWAARQCPDAPATTLFSKLELTILRRTDPKKRGLPPRPTVRHALMAVARVGGHKKSNGEPGWQVLGRGLRRLLERVEGARALLDVMRSDSTFDAEDGVM